MQETRLIENEYSVNLRSRYYYEKAWHEGWINVVNPFRATIVLGTPGSGKSYTVVNSFIRQQIEKGDMTPYEQVLAELNARDAQDMNRETDPLRQAEDAVLVDSTNMTPEQVVDAIIAVVEDVYGKRA